MKLNLLESEKKTFALHLAYSFIEGILEAALLLNEFVFIKSLRGSNYQLGFLFQFSVIVLILSVFFNEFIRRTYNKKKLLRIVGFSARLPFILLLFFPRDVNALLTNPVYHYIFLAIFLIYYLETPVIFPLINLFLKNRYSDKNFGRLYSYSTTVKKVVIFVTTFTYGFLLDYDHFAFTYVFPILSVLGIISVFLLSKIDFTEKEFEPVKKSFFSSIRDSAKNMVRVISANKPFRDFEIGFMCYGFAYMITITVITIFFNKVLNLSYTSFAFYKNLFNILSIILTPFVGRFLGKSDPRKFAVVMFSSLMLYIFFISLTKYFPNQFNIWGIQIYTTLVISFTFYGIFYATMSLIWNIGSSYFCEPEEAGHYQSIHLSLTGVRGIFAPLLGIFFYELLGFSGNFMIGMVALFIAIMVMFVSIGRYKIK